MDFRSKPVGWKYESSRHSLAARGIKSKYFSPYVTAYIPDEWNEVRKENKIKDIQRGVEGKVIIRDSAHKKIHDARERYLEQLNKTAKLGLEYDNTKLRMYGDRELDKDDVSERKKTKRVLGIVKDNRDYRQGRFDNLRSW